MEREVSCQNSSHHKVCSTFSMSAQQSDSMCLSSWPNAVLHPSPQQFLFHSQNYGAFQKAPCCTKRSHGWVGGACVSTRRGCGTWALKGTADISLPGCSYSGANTQKTPFCSCANWSHRSATHSPPSMIIINSLVHWPYTGRNEKWPLSLLALFQLHKIKKKPEV